MIYKISSQYLSIHCAPELQPTLQSLTPYLTNDAAENAINVDIIRYRFLDRQIPERKNDYSGFLTHKSCDPDRAPFIFCFREGKLIFGMQKEDKNFYNVYIHSQSGTSCKTAIQYILLLEGCHKGYLGVHSVTLELNGSGIMFSAPSGTGKTTHTELWRKEFGSRILNGDFAMLKCVDNSVSFEGTPFCGSSPYAERGEWPVTDIIFLSQSPENSICRITRLAAIAHAMENCFIPRWDTEAAQVCMKLIGNLLKNVRVWALACNMEPQAAHVARDAIMKAD